MENNYKIILKSSKGNEISEYINLGTVLEEYGEKVVKYTNYEGDISYDTKMVIGSDIISVINSGNIESVMNFEKGRTYSSVIKTEFGNIPLEIKSKQILKDIRESSLYIMIEYEAFYSENPELFKIELIADRIIQ
jgi:uncharacterized beta-barrel protein YwiB (DUF1934 family)